ncbi:type VI secretion system baseplate subunit TssG [Dyella lutea]|uniref:Type VI secretion system baseplate subunit TssG n=1 Tax=Dyella lutea TaxID=2950441 RepID=A0ABT1FB34_9GAMM|nr:type VI secretion system baseplate subunit TssG [Dyella lutea]MCP1374572.1 type VI secretion system baseplate subunit TssG [Dyella lutea]
MAGTAGQAPDPLAPLAALRDEPERFDFFDAVRRIECAHPDKPRLGESTKPSEDPVRLRHTPSLAFSPRTLDRFEPASSEQPHRLYGLFLGLFGPNAPLPLHLTEYTIDRQINARDRTLSAFADIFHHRMMSLFYRTWADAQPTVQYDRPKQDRFGGYIGALVGLATPHAGDRDAMPDRFKRFFAGRLLTQARSPEGLRQLLQDFFRVPVRVLEYVAEWMRLPDESHLRLGLSPQVAGLGRTAVLGDAVWEAQQRFRLRIGPLDAAQFRHFLPGEEALQQLVAAVRTYVGDEKAWDVQLVLRREDVPVTRLGQSGRMGLTTWLGRRDQLTDADDVVLRPAG